MRINLWYSKDMNQWRWSLYDGKEQRTGGKEELRTVMNDISNIIETLVEKKIYNK